MGYNTCLFVVPLEHATLLPDQWFEHFIFRNEDKEDIISEFCNFKYAAIFLTPERKCEVYFGQDNIAEDSVIYREPNEIKQAIFNALLEYE